MTMIVPGNLTHTFAIAGSATFLNSSTFMADGRPSQVTRCTFITGAQTIASKTTITVTLADPDGGTVKWGAIGIFGITGLLLNQKVVFNGDTSNPVTLAKCPTGGLMAVYIPTAVVTSSSVTIDFYNDVAGGVVLTPGAPFEVGEILIGNRWIAKDGVQADWKYKLMDPSVIRDSGDNQPNKLMKFPYRVATLNSTWMDWNETFGTPTLNPWNLQDLNILCVKTNRQLIIPRWRTTLGSITPDKPSIVATGIIGCLTQSGDIENQNGVYFKQQWSLREFVHG